MSRIPSIRYLLADTACALAMLWLVFVLFAMAVGPLLLGDAAVSLDLGQRNLPPLSPTSDGLSLLGTDSLGRSMFARIVVAAQTTVGIALVATTLSMTCGGLIGVWVATQGGWASAIVMRLVDVIMSFPSLLMALVVLYVLGPSPANIVLVLAITRLPIFIRTARSQALEIKERPFVKSARVTGAGTLHIARKHVVPLVLPTVLTVASLEFAFIILAESALSFLGVGVQPPGMTWGLMVSQGRAYLASAWWLSFWPGLAIMLTALSANILANQFRLESDPVLASRLTQGARADA